MLPFFGDLAAVAGGRPELRRAGGTIVAGDGVSATGVSGVPVRSPPREESLRSFTEAIDSEVSGAFGTTGFLSFGSLLLRSVRGGWVGLSKKMINRLIYY